MKFLGNDPTGTYKGKFQKKPWKRRMRRFKGNSGGSGSVVKKSGKFSVEVYHQDSGSSKSPPAIRLSTVPSKPDHNKWIESQVSSDFWNRVKPKVPQPMPE